MRAIVLAKFGGLDSLVYTELPEPEPMAGHVVIAIKAFGLNHAEMHMRRGEWAEAAQVIGIECVGLVHSCPGGEFPRGPQWASKSATHRWLQRWQAEGTLAAMQARPLGVAEARGRIHWEYGAVDGACAPWQGWGRGRRPRGARHRPPHPQADGGARDALGQPDD